MKRLNVDLQHCYGIKKLTHDFDFSDCAAYAIYAPNGAMKSSLARTFNDICEGVESGDRFFTTRPSYRTITDETGAALTKDRILVVSPYEEVIGNAEKHSTLLVDTVLRKEYEELHAGIEQATETFLSDMKVVSGSKRDLRKEISLAFTQTESSFLRALNGVREEVIALHTASYAFVEYDTLFDEKALELIATDNIKNLLHQYVQLYKELLSRSKFFKRDTFDYYNGTNVARVLSENGFFKAKHSIVLNGDEPLALYGADDLDKLIESEKASITNDPKLRNKLKEIDKALHKNINVRKFEAYVSQHPEVLPGLENPVGLKTEVWKSYFKQAFSSYENLVQRYRTAQQRSKQIEDAAAGQRTQWENVIKLFNDRFFVPFRLEAKNKAQVVVGQEPILKLGFLFKDDGGECVSVQEDALLRSLSTGEKRAYYILNLLFEIEARLHAGQETLLVIDDIADSFDYKNKYAIIQYLMDISQSPRFKQLILTHNFDFFRTISSRFVGYNRCLTTLKNSNGVTLNQASGINNIFVNDWKKKFLTVPRKRVASIPFIRNMVEFTKGEADPDYATLTALLHWKSNLTDQITEKQFLNIYNKMFSTSGAIKGKIRTVYEVIQTEAEGCVQDSDGSLEAKIVLSICIRLKADQFMINRINDPAFVSSITSKQSGRLYREFRARFSSETENIEVLGRVLLMTPENIHLNSFMYEPILDMNDDHLRKLYADVSSLKYVARA